MIIPPLPDSTPPIQLFMIQVAKTAENAIKLPTERSIPAVIITRVIPIANMAITAIGWQCSKDGDFQKIRPSIGFRVYNFHLLHFWIVFEILQHWKSWRNSAHRPRPPSPPHLQKLALMH